MLRGKRAYDGSTYSAHRRLSRDASGDLGVFLSGGGIGDDPQSGGGSGKFSNGGTHTTTAETESQHSSSALGTHHGTPVKHTLNSKRSSATSITIPENQVLTQ